MISSKATKRDSLLFVYGTLRKFVDIAMARRLRRCGKHLGIAVAPGRLYDLGSYPGLKRPRSRGDRVVGDVYALGAPREILAILDRYEAGQPGRERARFVRVQSVVAFANGARRRAWLYLYRPPVRPQWRIRCGDYERYLKGVHPRAEV
jgi:gamma-glutamylcyclotransferase (GGCT)/AIG2-like uncharacterized protein YtfP